MRVLFYAQMPQKQKLEGIDQQPIHSRQSRPRVPAVGRRWACYAYITTSEPKERVYVFC